MKLLILGVAILATDALGPIEDDGPEFRVPLVDGTAQVWQKTLGDMRLIEIDDAAVPGGFTAGGFEYVDGALVRKPGPPPSQHEKDAFMKQVDADADAIIYAVIGNREKEYSDAYADAKAFAAAGYMTAVPQTVADWAEIKGQTLRWAADNVIATGGAWVAASAVIRRNRLARKEDARKAETVEQLAAAKQAWEVFKGQIRSQLGV